MILADMYALGLIASFCINMGALLIYRYSMGTKEVIQYNTNRLGTLVLWVILLSCFVFLAVDKIHGTMLWGGVTGIVLVAGLLVAKKRAPEIRHLGEADSEMEMILYLSSSPQPDLHIIFQRPREEAISSPKDNEVFVTYYSPRQGIPAKMAVNHFRFPLRNSGLYQSMLALLRIVGRRIDGAPADVVSKAVERGHEERSEEALVVDGDRLVGANCVGFSEHVGALRGLIEGRRRLGSWKRRLMEDPSRVVSAYVATANGLA